MIYKIYQSLLFPLVASLTLDNVLHVQKALNTPPNAKNLDQKQIDLDKKMESLAVVPYNSEILSPFHFDKRQFYLAGQNIVIKQKWGQLGVAAVVWDAAVVLCEYLEKHRNMLEDKTVIELGAGMGLAGMVAGLLGVGRIDITDREIVLDDLRQNIQENVHNQVSLKTIQVKALDWSHDLENFTDHYDLVIGADIVYIEETFEDLLRTISHLAQPETEVILASKIRYKRDKDFYKMLGKTFSLAKVHYDKDKDIVIYKAKLRIHKEL
ncbi:unnamed protein product [Owenia fusiformis]|uniref:Uncharacterized protein n=1 Tax=Owenia fusiformis TaxID=6347 RepID=A0A8J1Y4E2_OWEFU|nr:unnamed protein product [Owenia fusiformis]